MLKFNGDWRFDSPGEVARGVINGFSELIGKVVNQGDQQRILEHFKAYFAGAVGTTTSWSSSASWAQTDLDNYMDRAAANAPLFIEAFYDACAALQNAHPEITVPDVNRINRVLAEHAAGYEIQPPHLISRNPQAPITVPGGGVA